MESSEILTPAAAGAYLATELGGTAERWQTWLKNDRKPGRKQLLPPLAGPGRPRYLRVAVDALIATERGKRIAAGQPISRAAEVMKAFGIGEGGTSTGRPLDARIYGQIDERSQEGFVQLHVAHPLLVFRLTPSEARTLSAALSAEANDAEHMARLARGQT